MVLVRHPKSCLSLYVGSVYRRDRHEDPESVDTMLDWLTNVLTHIGDHEFVLGGDLNVRHPVVGCCHPGKSNRAGFLTDFPGVRLLNNGSATRASHLSSSCQDAPSALDVTLSSKRVTKFGEWKTGSQGRSDPRSITLEAALPGLTPPAHRSRHWCSRSAL
jgi:hypothetical protein